MFFCISLCIGSFLNVVIYRLPVMMDRQWRQEAAELLAPLMPRARRSPACRSPFNLMMPASHCPHCGPCDHPLENIPVISWLFAQRQMQRLQQPDQPPLPAGGTGYRPAVAAGVPDTGAGKGAGYAIPMTWALISLTMIDFDTQLLPDSITLPLLWAGLLVNLGGTFVPLETAVLGAMAGYLVLWSVYWLFKLVTGKEGMGHGDFKLLAALGAWLGWTMVPLVLLLSSVVGALIGLGYLAVRKESAPFAFGPYIAIAGFVALLWGQPLLQWYLG
jgi:leader peptidase (prepilin peptidase)/N-methyltransferase